MTTCIEQIKIIFILAKAKKERKIGEGILFTTGLVSRELTSLPDPV